MLTDELDQPFVNLRPVLVGAHGLQIHVRHLDGQVHVAEMTDVDDGWIGRSRAHQESSQLLERLLRGGQSDANGTSGQ